MSAYLRPLKGKTALLKSKNSFKVVKNARKIPHDNSDKAALDNLLELLNHKNDEMLTKTRQYLDTKQTLSHFESFKSRISASTSHKSQVESSKYLSASLTSSERS